MTEPTVAFTFEDVAQIGKPTASDIFDRALVEVIAEWTGVRQPRAKIPERWRLDPVPFVHEVLQHQTWSIQEDMLRAALTPNARVAIKACHNSSKTFSMCELAIWWVVCYGGRVITTAPTERQVKSVIWAQMRMFVMESGITTGAFGLYVPEPNRMSWEIEPGVSALGMTTDTSSGAQGWKGGGEKRPLLIIIDEAQGCPASLFEGMESFGGGDVRIIMTGNAITIGGPFYEAFHKNRDEWDCRTITAFDTPNLAGLIPADKIVEELTDDELGEILLGLSPEELSVTVPGFGGMHSRHRARQLVGKGRRWETRVMARFPSQAEGALIPMYLLERCAKLPSLLEVRGPAERDIVVGIDVAGQGRAESVVVLRRGKDLLDIRVFEEDDPRGPIAQYLWEYKDRIRSIHIDADGIGDRDARDLEARGFPVYRPHDQDSIGIRSGSSPVGRTPLDRDVAKERFENLKAQMWWYFRDLLEAGEVRGLRDPVTMSQLGTVKERTTLKGKRAVETKEQMAKRGVDSPDRADAIVYAFFDFPEDDSPPRVWS